MIHRVFLSIGSNVGKRRENLHKAIAALQKNLHIEQISKIYETQPWGFTDQPAFLNQVLSAETVLEPLELLAEVKNIEKEMGRTPTFRYGPRVIDIDILFFDDLVMDEESLSIPHPMITERAFVLVPLDEIAPQLIHPLLQQTIHDLVQYVDQQGILPLEESTLKEQPLAEKTILPFGTRTFIMGIINLTPDSFSGDGLMKKEDTIAAAVEQAIRFLEEGADILDLGAESSRPGSEPVSAVIELERLLPVLKQIVKLNSGAIISIDTYKASVAEQCLAAGATMINDIWGLKKDSELAKVTASYKVPIVLMHNRSHTDFLQKSKTLGAMYAGTAYQDLMGEICSDLQESIATAKSAGIRDQNIILDPGVGFGKTVEQNLSIIHHLKDMRKMGYPILLGVSRKSFIGYTLNLPPEERLEGTATAVALGIYNGADIIRVHDVGIMTRVAKMSDAIVRS